MKISKIIATSPLSHASALTCSQWRTGEEKGPIVGKRVEADTGESSRRFLAYLRRELRTGVLSSPPKATLWGCSLEPPAEIVTLLATLPPTQHFPECAVNFLSITLKIKANSPQGLCDSALPSLQNSPLLCPQLCSSLAGLSCVSNMSRHFPPYSVWTDFSLCLECSSPRSAHSWLHSPFGSLSNKEPFLMILPKVTYPMPPDCPTTAHHSLSKQHTYLLHCTQHLPN